MKKIFLSLTALFLLSSCQKTVFLSSPEEVLSQAFLSSGLTTDTSKTSVDLKNILDGGPGKDGIPALNNPDFTTISEASQTITDQTLGLFVTVGNEKRFYPYNILVWHEIVNDDVGGKPLAITFCPLCGSAIVFERTLDGIILDFGVSGKLYESNLLMFDRTSESLWSQIRGEAIVGSYTGSKLQLYPFELLSFESVKKQHPETKILSVLTGHSRDYRFYPYGDYESSNDIYFPISVQDRRLPAKEPLYIIQVDDRSVAFAYKDLKEETATLTINNNTITAARSGEKVILTKNGQTLDIPGYFAMFFSWAIHHQEDGILWKR